MARIAPLSLGLGETRHSSPRQLGEDQRCARRWRLADNTNLILPLHDPAYDAGIDQSPPSQQGQKRHALRVAVWLANVLRYMPDVPRLPKSVHAFIERRLDLLAGFVIHLVFMRAAQLCRPGQRQRNLFTVGRASARHDVRTQITHSMRATIGGQLRRQLNPCGRGAKHLKARAAAILTALRMVDVIAARFIRRMKKGLSRRASAHSRVKAALLPVAASLSSIVAFAQDACIARAPP